MALDPRQAFKFGFLMQCAREGLTPEQTQARIAQCLEKTAGDGSWLDLLMSPVRMGAGAAALGVGGAAMGGAGAGYLAAKLTEPQVGVEEAKQQELINALKLHTAHARRMAARRTYRPARAPSPPRFS